MVLSTIILAAGLGTRMKSGTAKVLHSLCGRPLVEYPVRLSRALGAQRTLLVLGHQADRVEQVVRARCGEQAVEVVLQREQRGTGHAVQQAIPHLSGVSGKV